MEQIGAFRMSAPRITFTIAVDHENREHPIHRFHRFQSQTHISDFSVPTSLFSGSLWCKGVTKEIHPGAENPKSA